MSILNKLKNTTSLLHILRVQFLLWLAMEPTVNDLIYGVPQSRLRSVFSTIQREFASKILWDDSRLCFVNRTKSYNLISSVMMLPSVHVSGSKTCLTWRSTQIKENPEGLLNTPRVLVRSENAGEIRLTLVKMHFLPLRIEVQYEVSRTPELLKPLLPLGVNQSNIKGI